MTPSERARARRALRIRTAAALRASLAGAEPTADFHARRRAALQAAAPAKA